MRMTWKRLNDYYPDWLYTGSSYFPPKGGVFTYLKRYSNCQWLTSYDDAYKLDMYYHGVRSGNKIASDMLEILANTKYTAGNYSLFQAVAELLAVKYETNWNKLYNTTKLTYNPINNYDMTEESTDTTDATRTPNLSRENTRTPNVTKTTSSEVTTSDNDTTTRTPDLTETDSETRTPDLTQDVSATRTPNLTEETDSTRTPNTTSTETIKGHITGVDNKVFGYNSTTAVPDGTSTTTENGTTTTAESGTETNKGSTKTTGTDVTDTVTTQTGTETIERTNATTGTEKTESSRSGSNSMNITESESGSEVTVETESGTDNTNTTFKHKLTRSGNIGVTTSQQMIQSERELWIWNFIEQVCKDIDSVLTCNIW